MLDSATAATPKPAHPALPPCSCGAPHPATAGGAPLGSFTRADGWPLAAGVERLDLFSCAECTSTRALEVHVASTPLQGALGSYLVARGHVAADELSPGEAAALAAAGVLLAADARRLTVAARFAAGCALGLDLSRGRLSSAVRAQA